MMTLHLKMIKCNFTRNAYVHMFKFTDTRNNFTINIFTSQAICLQWESNFSLIANICFHLYLPLSGTILQNMSCQHWRKISKSK